MLRVLLLSMVVGAAYGRDPGNIVVTATPVTAGGAATVVVYGNSTSRRLTVVLCLRLFLFLTQLEVLHHTHACFIRRALADAPPRLSPCKYILRHAVFYTRNNSEDVLPKNVPRELHVLSGVGCAPYTITRKEGVTTVVLVDRGDCTFAEKAGNASAAGADAIIIRNSIAVSLRTLCHYKH